MAWQQRSHRRTELPKDWRTIRRAVLDRDGHTCTIRGPRCTTIATHVDHTDDALGPHDHRPEVLRAACQTCHMGRTQAQSRLAIQHKTRRPEAHPNQRGGGCSTPADPYHRYV